MDESQQKQAWITSLRLLAASPKTSKQLADMLTEKGYPAEVVQGTVSRLEERGLLSDRAFARQVAAKFEHAKPSGTRKIAFELKRKGFSRALREEVLSEMTPESEAARCKELAEDKWLRFQNLEPVKRKKKIYDFLVRRGFDFEIVRDVMSRMKDDDAT